MASDSSAPIGIFDSGIGGLTVARAVKQLLPAEQLIYFGDTAHLPYGDKSTASIQAYSIKITQLLIDRGCKLILIACNSASAAGYELVSEYTGRKAKIMNVIDPVIDYLREKYAHKTVGLIGTKRTVQSNVYQQKVTEIDKQITVKAKATPLLVPMIEEGFFTGEISQQIIEKYLSDPWLQDIEALILGCTHYPLIKTSIKKYYGPLVEVIDSSEIVARALRGFLEYHNLKNLDSCQSDTFLVTDYTKSFEASTRMFFGKKIQLQRSDLWD